MISDFFFFLGFTFWFLGFFKSYASRHISCCPYCWVAQAQLWDDPKHPADLLHMLPNSPNSGQTHPNTYTKAEPCVGTQLPGLTLSRKLSNVAHRSDFWHKFQRSWCIQSIRLSLGSTKTHFIPGKAVLSNSQCPCQIFWATLLHSLKRIWRNILCLVPIEP